QAEDGIRDFHVTGVQTCALPISVEDKIRIVLSVLSGEMTIAEAARRNKVSEQSVSRWKAQFLEGGRAGVAEGGKAGPSSREEQLQAQIDELTTALGEAHVEIRRAHV